MPARQQKATNKNFLYRFYNRIYPLSVRISEKKSEDL